VEGFYLLCGHLLGDFILQNDWMARNKANKHPGPEPFRGRKWIKPDDQYPGPWSVEADPTDRIAFAAAMDARNERIQAWKAEKEQHARDRVIYDDWLRDYEAYLLGHLTCLLHCALYTTAIYLFTFWWMTPLGLAWCFMLHFMIDRWRLARKWMEAMGQAEFATGPFAPWSIVVVDNTLHLLTLAIIAACLL
jgi:hypothetical protein